MRNISLNYSNVLPFISEEEINNYAELVKLSHQKLNNMTGEGNDFLGWLNLPFNYDKDEYERIKQSAQYIKENADILVVVGIGGSYLGARAVIEALTNPFTKNGLQVYFVGNNLSSKYVTDLLAEIKDKRVCVNVISKSGTTTEPAIAFRIFKNFMEEKYGKDEAKNRIFVTTDKERGALKKVANECGYQTFVIPDDVGGRYSVLTAVGLLPIAACGINIDEIMKGAQDMVHISNNENLFENDCYKYAAIRNVLYNKGKKIEIMVNYEPTLHFFTEWWKQLYGESEGKQNRGIFPAGVDNTTDLHSMGQYIQEGERHLFETVLNIEDDEYNFVIKSEPENPDGMQFVEGKTLDFVNKKAMEGTIIAHVNGQVPNILINIPKCTEYYIGQLIYFFEKACGISGYILDVNPFNQPGVEEYKKNMFRLLGK